MGSTTRGGGKGGGGQGGGMLAGQVSPLAAVEIRRADFHPAWASGGVGWAAFLHVGGYAMALEI